MGGRYTVMTGVEDKTHSNTNQRDNDGGTGPGDAQINRQVRVISQWEPRICEGTSRKTDTGSVRSITRGNRSDMNLGWTAGEYPIGGDFVPDIHCGKNIRWWYRHSPLARKKVVCEDREGVGIV